MMMIRNNIPHTPLDLTDFTTDTEEYAGLRVRKPEGDINIISVYIRPNKPWNADNLVAVATHKEGHLILAGHFNARNKIWGDNITTVRGRQLLEALNALNLKNILLGTPTFARSGILCSKPDLTVVSPISSFAHSHNPTHGEVITCPSWSAGAHFPPKKPAK